MFDVGGVLVASGEPVSRRRWEHNLGLPPGQLDVLLADAIGPGWKGGRSETDIWVRFQSSLAISDADFVLLRRDLFAHEYLEPAFARFVQRARGTYRLGIITNNGPGARHDLQRRFGLCDMVDCFVVAAEEGVEKPHAAIYTAAAARLGVAPEACVFVDDSLPNVAGAEAIGMTGVIHRDPAETFDRLRVLCPL